MNLFNKYSKNFYSNIESSAFSSAKVIVPIVSDLIKPRSVVDFGCGTGIWLSIFKENSVEKILGLDGNWVEKISKKIDDEEFIVADLSQPDSIMDIGRFDLVICLEVAEHLPVEVSGKLIEKLTDSGNVVLFSAAVPYQGGVNHINEQWPEYWSSLFRQRGYVAVDCLRGDFWNNPKVKWWYAQNIMLYVNKQAMNDFPKLLNSHLEQRFQPTPVIHPNLYLKMADYHQISISRILGLLWKNILYKLGLLK